MHIHKHYIYIYIHIYAHLLIYLRNNTGHIPVVYCLSELQNQIILYASFPIPNINLLLLLYQLP